VDSFVVLASRRHDRANKIAWDPSGRFLATSTITELRNAHVRGRPDDGVNFYNFQGTLVHQFKKEKLHSFAWRPRPKDLLTPEQRKNVIKNLSKYEKEFKKVDDERNIAYLEEVKRERFEIARRFIKWRNENRALCSQLKPVRVAIRDGYDSDDDANYEIEVIVSYSTG
jgi:translation initiation factor 3 subunit B